MPALTLLTCSPEAQLQFSKSPQSAGDPVRLRLVNDSEHLVAYKVKSTAPKQFVIKPSTGSIRKGETAEVSIVRKAPEGEAEAAATGKRPDRFLVQAAIVDTDEKRLLLHAAHRGKAQGAAQFWDGVPKDVLQEQQLEAVYVDGPVAPEPNDASPPGSAAEEGARPAKGASKGKRPSSPEQEADVTIGKASDVSPPGPTGRANSRTATPPPAQATTSTEGREPLNLKKKGENKRKDDRADVVLQKHSRPVTHVAVDPSGKVLYTCGKDKLVMAWSLPEGEYLKTFEGHRGAVWSCSVSPDGTYLLSCGADNMVLLWEASAARRLADAQLPGVARDIAWAPRSGPHGGGLRRAVACSNSFKDRPAAIALLDFPAPCFRGLASGDSGGPRAVLTIEEPTLPSGPTQVAFVGSDSSTICSVHASGEILFWSSTEGHMIGRLEAHTGAVSMAAFPSDRTLMASCGRTDLLVKLWDLSKGVGPGQIQVLQTHQSDRPLNAVALRPSLTRAEVVAAMGGEARTVCDVLIGGGQDARDVALVGAGTDDQFEPLQLKLGEGSTMAVYHPPNHDSKGKGAGGGHFGPIHALSFAIETDLCISAAEDGNVRLRSLYPVVAGSAAGSTASPPQPAAQARTPAPQPAQAATTKMIAKFDFGADQIEWPATAQHKPLNMKRGQELEVLQDVGSGWLLGRLVDSPQTTGLFPSNYAMSFPEYSKLQQQQQQQQQQHQ